GAAHPLPSDVASNSAESEALFDIDTIAQFCDARSAASPLSRFMYIQPARSPGVLRIGGNLELVTDGADVAGSVKSSGVQRARQMRPDTLGFSCSSKRTISRNGSAEFDAALAHVSPPSVVPSRQIL